MSIVLLCALAVTVASAAWAEKVRVRAGIRDDYGRIVFSWNSPVGYKSSLKGGAFTISFARPIEATYGPVTRSLKKFVKSATPGEDGRSVVFALSGDFDAYSYDSGSAIIVEIAQKEGGVPGAPPGPKKSATKDTAAKESAAPKQPAVQVRIGQHPKYTRLVFDWPRKVPYTFKQDGGIATVTFARSARINLKSLVSKPPRFVGGARAKSEADSVTVTLSVPATSTVKHFLAGSKIVLDIGQPSGSEKVEKLPPPQETKKAEAKKAEPKQARAPQKTTEKKTDAQETTQKAIKTAAKPATKSAETKTVQTTPGAPPGAPKALKPGPTQAEPSGPIAGPATGKTQTAASQVKTAAAGTQPPTPLTPPSATPSATPSASPGTAPATLAPKPLLPNAAPPPLPPTASQVSAVVSTEDNIVSLRFDWSEPVGAAVFNRAGFLWVAFDKPTAIDIDKLLVAGNEVLKGIEQMGTTEATVLRMSTAPGINVGLRRDGLAWLLDFHKNPVGVATALAVKAQPDSPVGARLFVPVTEPGKPIAITDPEVGDNLVIVPVIPLNHGIDLEYTYPQLRFLPTAQGLVIQPRADDIRVRPLRQGVEITSGNELLISAVSAEAEANRSLASMKPLSRVLDLEKWEVKNFNSIIDRKHELLAAITEAKGANLEPARLNLSRFYFANGFFVEALAVLQEVARDRKEIEQDPEYRVLRGVAQFMMGRYGEATADLTLDKLNLIDEAAFWRAAVLAGSGDLANTAGELRRTGQIIRPYPKAMKMPLGVLVTRSALEIGDIKQARRYLEILRLDDLTMEEALQLDLLEGKVMELTGDFEGAIGKWEKVKQGHHRPSSAEATVQRMELLLKLGRSTRKEAIKDLEGLRYAWRGAEFEFTLLRRLGGLYLEEGNYREGLERLRQAATHFRTHQDAPQVTQKMSDAFSDLFLNDKADTLAPVTAIGIYDEFKELTPAGAQGDEMIRKLADRLVGVDLLGRASALLASQVRFRLKGLDRARVGTQLALVHILAQEYAPALKVMAETAVPNMPEKLLAQRRHIRAKALLGGDQRDQTVELLKDDKSQDAELLRTELFWSSRQWPKAAASLRKLMAFYGAKAGAPLNDKQSSTVLSYAIAMGLSGNDRGLNRARVDFINAMDKTKLKDPFRLIVSPDSLGLIDPKDVSFRVKEVEKFQTFMAAYRERLRKQNLSELVPGLAPKGAEKPELKKPDATKPDTMKPGAAKKDAKKPAGKTPAKPTKKPAKAAPQA
ncbi:MAG: hypothetical protein HQ512_05305 [Rhodospirillales bacterium]|nr:hypothetical protein [Rhodospirillales bacterium]